MRETPGLLGKVWSATTAIAILAGAAWIDVPGTAALAVCAAATLIGLGTAVRAPRRWERAASVALVAFCAVAAASLHALDRLAQGWPAAATEITTESAAALQRALASTAGSLARIADAALDAPAGPDAARTFGALTRLIPAGREWTVVLMRGGHRVAWAGMARAPATPEPGPYVVVRTPFYIVLEAVVVRGADRAVAAALIHAEPPADRLAAPLDLDVARRTGVDGFSFDESGTDTARAAAASSGVAFAPGPDGRVLLTAVPLLPRQGGALLRAAERARRRGTVLLALALALFVAAAWRPPVRRTALGPRLAALAVALAVLALVPFSTFSNATELFDPTYYFSSVGGPYTGSVGVLALTGAALLLAALTVTRARLRPRPWWLVALVALSIALVTPTAVSHLADGITPPGVGVPLTIWLAWHVSLALVGTALLVAASGVARGAVGARAGIRRGIPSWVAPAVAVGAATIGPIVWDVPRQWPPWYVALWVLAAAAVVFARPTKWGVLPAVAVAGLGAGVLVWGTTAQKRLLLAERDVTGLNRPDPDAGELLDRFGAEVAASPPPRDRGDLLKLYARSVLAEADYPVSLALWFGDERPPEHIATSVFASDTGAILTTVAAAQQLHTGAIAEAVGSPGVQLVLAVPITAAPGDALSAVVAPQTRLIRESPVAPFLGLPADTGTAPLYTISLLAVRQAGAVSADTALPRMQWHRHGSALHGDWLVRGADGPVRAHVEIQLRPLRALVQRGVLLLVLDLLVVGPLWALSVLGDGAFWRWLRVRLRRWRRSYRTQLTVVLFAFFVAPAAVFAIWSERRLRTDDTDARALRVSETLRSVIAEGNLGRLDIAGGRLDTPLLLYDDGELVASSDTLYAELAPLGRLLRPDIELGLGLGGEVEASRTAYLAGVRMLIGYRVVTGENGEHLILAAPARFDAADIERPNEDLRVLVLFTTVLGAAAALWLSGLAARQLARPIDQLRRAALAVARGEREPALAGDPPVEFTPVFSAFRRMAADFGESQRVLAWGEMARQVAHEIKNPLTPIRLGIQHLLRARSDPRVDFDHVLRQNAERILTEIDRLDEIARSFSRYGTVPAERLPAERTDVAAVARDVLALERLGSGGGIAWALVGADADVAPVWARARADELREVLLNVLENARHAQSRRVRLHVAAEGARVTIAVEDDGDGIPPDILPHIFEPHFSTRTSGSGLGLAVSRRVIDGWGGSIAVASRRAERGGGGRGTRVTIVLRAS